MDNTPSVLPLRMVQGYRNFKKKLPKPTHVRTRTPGPRYVVIFKLLIWLSVFGMALVFVQGFDVPPHDDYVTDLAGVLDEASEAALEQTFYELWQATDVEGAIAILPSLEGEVLENVSIEIAEARGIGDAETDNGFLMLVAIEDREARIEIGYGLEHILTDGRTKRIAEANFPPNFRNGDYYEGLFGALYDIRGHIEQDEQILAYYEDSVAANSVYDESSRTRRSYLSFEMLPVAIIILLIVAIAVVEIYVVETKGKSRSIAKNGWRNFSVLFLVMFLVFFVFTFLVVTALSIAAGVALFALMVGFSDGSGSSSSGYRSSSSSSRSSGSSRSSSSSSSSFGGFSGGSFGGGGASTSW